MASGGCLRSLIRPPILGAPRIHLVVLGAATFSCSSARAAKAQVLYKNRRDLPRAVKSNWNNAKKRPVVRTGKRSRAGERKAFRKLVLVNNRTALPVPGLGELEAETMASNDSKGKMFAIPDKMVDSLMALGAFKPTQMWHLFRRPHVLMRDEAVDLMKRLEASAEEKQAYRCVLTGSRLSGKSLTLLQAMCYALLNGWVVIHIPEAQDLTNGNTDYSPIADTRPLQFSQPAYCLKLLKNMYRPNKTVLELLRLRKDWSKVTNLKQGTTLADLVLSAKEREHAWPTLVALWTELTQRGRPPVLFSLDGLAHINKLSDYRDPSFKLVHAHDLTLVGMFIKALSGKTELPNGGAIMAATSESNTHHHPSQEVALAQLEASQAGREGPQLNPYERKHDQRIYDGLKNSHVLRLGGVSKEEGKALLEYWSASGLLKMLLDTRTVSEQWALGGHGIVGEMERAALMSLRM